MFQETLSGKRTPPRLISGELCRDLSLNAAIDIVVAQFPNRIAVTYKNTSLTYLELNTSSTLLALELKKLGVISGQRIAVLMDRSEKMILSILAILKLGCSYIPIDVNCPKDRIDFILEDSKANAIILGDSAGYDSSSFTIPSIIEHMISHDGSKDSFLDSPAKGSDLAYIIYTSGSTGKPKGVQVTHSNVHNYAYWFCSEFSMTEADSIDFSSTLAFDFSVTSTIVPLLCGAKIQICSQEIKELPHRYLSYLEKSGISFIKLTPSYFNQLSKLIGDESVLLSELTIVLGGEALIPGDVKTWLVQYPEHRVINEYGPTETTVATLAYKISHSNNYLETPNLPIGFPAYNTEVYILDEYQGICEKGTIGELYIAGDSVSAGYLDRPELNSSTFIQNPFGSGELYKTGDLGRQLDDGNIEYLGRIDDQIKIRGYRIELGEVEATLLSHNLVESVTVQPFSANQETKLVAYLKLCVDKVASIFELRQYLKKRLPEYMIPSYFIFLDKMPLTVNGKLDRRALPLPGDSSLGIEGIKPENDAERAILDIWVSVLNTTLGVTDDFFVLGGESINAAQIIYQIEKKISVQLSLQDFYKYSNIRSLAEFVESKLLAAIEEDELLLGALAEIETMSESEIKLHLKGSNIKV